MWQSPTPAAHAVFLWDLLGADTPNCTDITPTEELFLHCFWGFVNAVVLVATLEVGIWDLFVTCRKCVWLKTFVLISFRKLWPLLCHKNLGVFFSVVAGCGRRCNMCSKAFWKMKMPAETGILLFGRHIILPAAGYHRNLKKESSTVVFMPCRVALGGGLYGNWACATKINPKKCSSCSVVMWVSQSLKQRCTEGTCQKTFATDL